MGGVDELARLAGVDSERLLDEYRLASIDGQQSGVPMPWMRGRDVDGVDVGILGQCLVARVALADTEPVAERVGRPLAARPDRDHLGVRQQLQVAGECPSDTARPDDSPPNRLASYDRHRHLLVVSPAVIGNLNNRVVLCPRAFATASTMHSPGRRQPPSPAMSNASLMPTGRARLRSPRSSQPRTTYAPTPPTGCPPPTQLLARRCDTSSAASRIFNRAR